jgi:hypothetical protein
MNASMFEIFVELRPFLQAAHEFCFDLLLLILSVLLSLRIIKEELGKLKGGTAKVAIPRRPKLAARVEKPPSE